MPTLERIESPQMMEVHVNGPGRANRLFIFTGIGQFNWHRSDDEHWGSESLRISMHCFGDDLPRIFEDQVVSSLATVSLASIYSRETGRRDKVGFSVNSVETFFTGELEIPDFGINAQLALLGNDVRFYRVSFQLTVLARV